MIWVTRISVIGESIARTESRLGYESIRVLIVGLRIKGVCSSSGTVAKKSFLGERASVGRS